MPRADETASSLCDLFSSGPAGIRGDATDGVDYCLFVAKRRHTAFEPDRLGVLLRADARGACRFGEHGPNPYRRKYASGCSEGHASWRRIHRDRRLGRLLGSARVLSNHPQHHAGACHLRLREATRGSLPHPALAAANSYHAERAGHRPLYLPIPASCRQASRPRRNLSAKLNRSHACLHRAFRMCVRWR